ncbi:MAG: diguanylate cyclase [Clostridiales bacterium]|jgi:diguanylate cyclase (GGDEF)-like protein|nr:diguanylate cyclase [Clostridiales bacterium]
MEDVYNKIDYALSSLLANETFDRLDLPAPYKSFEDKLLTLQSMNAELQRFTVQLSSGEIDTDPPSRSNYLAAGLKRLQSQMRHLTWQTQCVADGDYNQRIDFMGEFSMAFNQMVEQLKAREDSIRSQQDFMTRLFDKIEPIFVVSEEDHSRTLYTNYAARQLFFVHETNEQNTLMQNILTEVAGDGEYEVIDAGAGRWYSVTAARLPWNMEESALLCYCVDITAHKERENNLELAANTDALTNLSNRRALESELNSLWALCMHFQKPLSTLMFDIDNFKRYNDTYGHLQGDRCLAEFAKILHENAARSNDVVARYGGEEFTVLLPFTTLETALRIAENIRWATQERVIPMPAPGRSDVETRVTVSGGVCTIFPSEMYTPMLFLGATDVALYTAKQNGRNRICYRDMTDMF